MASPRLRKLRIARVLAARQAPAPAAPATKKKAAPTAAPKKVKNNVAKKTD